MQEKETNEPFVIFLPDTLSDPEIMLINTRRNDDRI